MFFRLLWRLARRNFGIHYFWPLIIAIGVESLFAYSRPGWPGFWRHWLSLSHLAGLLSVYITFVWVIAIYLKKASDVRSTRVQTLDDILPDAARYFAIGTIPLKDWFDPDSQVYLATIIRYQHSPTNLKHERVLLFFSDYQLQALKASYLDEHHARCLLSIHKRFDITLAFLGPAQLQSIFGSLSDDCKSALGCYRRFAKRLPTRFQMRKQPASLPFAYIEMKDGGEKFLKFRKGKTVLGLDEIQDTPVTKACKALILAMEKEIYVPDSNPRRLKHEFDFNDLLCP
jgi:hypothetical protein